MAANTVSIDGANRASAPYSLTAATFVGTAFCGMKTTHRTPAILAA
jgi:hypothetical protein